MNRYWSLEYMHVGWYICEGRCPPVCYWDGVLFHTLSPSMGFTQHNEQMHWDEDPKFGTVRPIMPLEEALALANITVEGYNDRRIPDRD